MSRYIDADKLKEECYKFANEVSRSAMAFVQGQINAAPTADVVAVVRCRDCIHNRDNGGDCDRTIILNEYDSTEYRCAGLEYCSYGERREDER
jgi:hypothetical protein